jgi:hypothetical protein
MFSKSLLLGLVSITLLSACQNSMPLPAATFARPIMAQSVARQSTQPESLRFTIEVAAAFHDAWRAGRRKPDGSYEPRIKETKDPVWIKAHNTNQVDIANTPYQALPADWQAENKASAEIAVQLILAQKGQLLTPDFIEQGSNLIHVKWLERNAWAKGGELDKPYAQLPEPEKQKDREALYQAIHKGLALKILNPQQVSAPVSAAIAQMLAKIKN